MVAVDSRIGSTSLQAISGGRQQARVAIGIETIPFADRMGEGGLHDLEAGTAVNCVCESLMTDFHPNLPSDIDPFLS